MFLWGHSLLKLLFWGSILGSVIFMQWSLDPETSVVLTSAFVSVTGTENSPQRVPHLELTSWFHLTENESSSLRSYWGLQCCSKTLWKQSCFHLCETRWGKKDLRHKTVKKNIWPSSSINYAYFLICLKMWWAILAF